MLRFIFFLIFFNFLLAEDLIENYPSSGPERIAHELYHNFLVEDVVSPMSGQVSLCLTDLVAEGAQPIAVKRYYVAPHIPCSFHADAKEDELKLYQYLKANYRGWVVLPHLHLKIVFGQKVSVHLREANGLILDFVLDPKTNTSRPKNPSLGFCNYSGSEPSGKLDIRNTQIRLKDGDQWIIVFQPDGTKRFYEQMQRLHQTANYFLRKEILPNGKVLRYHYKENYALSHIESLDPNEQCLYAAVRFEGEEDARRFTSHLGNVCSYAYQKRECKYANKTKEAKIKIHLLSPPLLSSCEGPFFREEKMAYCPRFLLSSYQSKDFDFQCVHHRIGEDNPHYRVGELFFPIGKNDEYVPIAKFSYDPAIPGKKPGCTEVAAPDGSKKIYHFSDRFLLTRLQYLNPNGKLHKECLYHWNDQNYLAIYEVKDAEGLLLKKTYEYDPFGNPIEEKIFGDLSGKGKEESYTIQREYSQDGFNLLLREEKQKGRITEYQYLPNTHLPTAKFSKDRNEQILQREFWIYDQHCNLIQTIIDDGFGKSIDNLDGVTERKITEYILREKAPFLHMTDWIHEKYVEEGKEKTLQKKQLHYDENGFVAQEDIYDAEGQYRYSIYKKYNERKDLLAETNPLGQKAVYQYDKHGRCQSGEDFSGLRKFQKAYDKRRRLKKHLIFSHKQNRTNHYSYDCKDRLIEKQDNYGNITSYAYAAFQDRPAKIRYPSVASALGGSLPVQTFSKYDALGRMLQHADANGHIAHYRYNAYGSPIEIHRPEGGIETFTYYKNGLCKTHTDPDGLTIKYTYDVLDRVLAKTYIFDDVPIADETFTYNALHLLAEKDQEGCKTSYSYDGAGRKIAEKKADRLTEYQYDALNRLQTTIKHNGENTLYIHYERDLLGRIEKEWHTDRTYKPLYQIAYTYDADGNRSSKVRFIENAPQKELYTFDAFHRPILFQDAKGNKTHYAYLEEHVNPLGQKVLQVQITGLLGRKVKKTYDVQGNLAEKEILNAQNKTLAKEQFFYDANGNLLQHHNFIFSQEEEIRTAITLYQYHQNNQLAKVTRAFGTPNERTTSFTYTPGGKLQQKIPPGQIALNYTYDPLGHLQTLQSSDGRIDHAFTHDKLGRLIEAIDRNQNIRITRKLDPFGKILQEDFGNYVIQKTYDPLGRTADLTLPDQSKIVYAYNAEYPKMVSRYNGERTYHHQFARYDLSGNLLEESLPSADAICYTYDASGNISAIQAPCLQEAYQYDPRSNLIQITTQEKTTHFQYDDLDQLTFEETAAYHFDSNYNLLSKNHKQNTINDLDEIISLGSLSCSYDVDGNLIEKGHTKFCYDPLGQLISAENPNLKVSYTYDPLGRRLQKTVHKNNASYQEEYLYDGEEEIAAYANKKLAQLKILSPSKKPVAIELNEKIFLPILDQAKNIRRLIDYSSQELQSYDYSVFGETTSSGRLFNPWRYKAKRYDFELNLYYFGKRYYDPELMRWLTPDPAGFADGMNLYAYVWNNPLKYFDPDGQFAFVIAIPLLWSAAEISAAIGWSVATVAIAWGGYELSKSVNQWVDNRAYKQSELEQQSGQATLEDEEQKKPPYDGRKLGDDPAKPPGEDFEWHGKGDPQSGKGAWYNPKTNESLHPDLDHPPPKKPHWDYRGIDGRARLNTDGTWEWK